MYRIPREKNFSMVCRSKPVTTFPENERKPVTLDQVLKEYYNNTEDKPKKKLLKKKLIKVDRQQEDIKKKYRIKKRKFIKITKKVDNFVYLSTLLSQQSKELRRVPTEDALVSKAIRRPLTSRSPRIRICTDMQIRSLASNSPKRGVTSIRSQSRGRATFYTESMSPSKAHTSSHNLLSAHKDQGKSRNYLRARPLTARVMISPHKAYRSQLSGVKFMK